MTTTRLHKDQTPIFSIVIPTRNRAEVLSVMLDCLKAQTIGAAGFEVIVLDDASTDHTWSVLQDHARSMENLRPQRVERPKGTGATCFISHLRNQGLRLAMGRIFVSLDDDSLVRPDYLEHLSRLHESSGIALVTGPIVDMARIPDLPLAEFTGKAGWHRNPIPGCNFSVPVETLRRIGGFDESFIHYGWEDLELLERLSSLGVGRVFDRSVGIYHAKTPTLRGSFADRLRLEMHRGTMGRLFYTKHPRFHIGLMTKQLGVLRAVSRGLDRLFGLDARVLAVAQGRKRAPGPVMRALLREHAEIAAERLLPRLGGGQDGG